jgi:hypothetical protein
MKITATTTTGATAKALIKTFSKMGPDRKVRPHSCFSLKPTSLSHALLARLVWRTFACASILQNSCIIVS